MSRVIKELAARLKTWADFDQAVVVSLDELDHRIYVLEENRKLKDEAIKKLQRDYQELRMGTLKSTNLGGKL